MHSLMIMIIGVHSPIPSDLACSYLELCSSS